MTLLFTNTVFFSAAFHMNRRSALRVGKILFCSMVPVTAQHSRDNELHCAFTSSSL
jgi:hypothetical protein